MKTKLILAIPLTIPKIVRGVIYWLDDYKKENYGKQEEVILCNETQTPEFLLYKASAYLVKSGGFTSHLAVVGRELGIPVYRYDNLDRKLLESGQEVMILPYISTNYVIPKSTNLYTRIITKKGDLDKLLEKYELYKEAFKQVSKEFEMLDIRIVDQRFEEIDNKRISIKVTYEIKNIDKLIEEIIKDPKRYMDIIEKSNNIAVNHLCIPVAEILTNYIISTYGLEKTMNSLKGVDAYWLKISKNYLKVRFGLDIDMENIDLGSYKKEENVCNEEKKLCDISEFIKTCIRKYESKNIVYNKN
ncbi:MAG: PEP-utilizing enzyme [Candidatus Aenigmatarchaeota archaeon]